MALLVGLIERLRSQHQNLQATEALLLLFLAWRLFARWRLQMAPNAPELYQDHSLFGSLRFTTSRAEYLAEGIKQSRDGQFSFWHGGNHVVVVSGEAARTSFQTSRGLNPSAGFAALFGSFLDISELTKNTMRKCMLIYKRCTQDDHLTTNLHHLVADSYAHVQGMGEAEVIDPLKFMGLLIYQLTHRMAGAHDIAKDPQLLRETWAVYGPLEDSPYIVILFPWLPTPSKLQKVWGYTKLHLTINKIAKKRQAAGKGSLDMLQMLMDEGMSSMIRSLAIIGAVLAGVFNTTFSTTWNLCCLATNPKWLERVKAEINDAVAKHRSAENESLVDIFQRLSLRDWESKFPILQAAITESIRFTMAGAVVRKNISGQDLKIGDTGRVIPNCSLAIHATADSHMNDDIYPDSLRWDPSRFTKKVPEGSDVPPWVPRLGFWKPSVPGQKGEYCRFRFPIYGEGHERNDADADLTQFAELNVVVASVLFIASYDFEMCDRFGNRINDPLPSIIYNRMGAGQPKTTMYMKCQRRC
ncbi:cytochrome P450 6A1 [Apiospora phragmitis]|uniref:Cytochrome P450 6A1 n=1 Tax=Apiospora phragmitis TaxID=2905665 RepID=A0ABR1W0T9_9PEZI